MRTILTCLILFVIIGPMSGKKVKFQVNMKNEIVNAMGVHAAGDFQTAAGFPGGDWNTATTELTQEQADTNIYSVVVDLPAFAKYEFKYINGIMGYETEFVPLESRVGYNFIDNRWIWIDSLSNDTTVLPAVLFANNAAEGKYLVRLKVDMQQETVNANGVHIAGFFNSFNPAANYMYSFDGNVYEFITYVDTGTSAAVYEYLFYNGNQSGQNEVVPSQCAAANNRRGISVAADVVLDPVCFGYCILCTEVGVQEVIDGDVNLYPNPVNEILFINSNKFEVSEIVIRDIAGRIVQEENISGNSFTIRKEKYSSGIYYVECKSNSGESLIRKIIVE